MPGLNLLMAHSRRPLRVIVLLFSSAHTSGGGCSRTARHVADIWRSLQPIRQTMAIRGNRLRHSSMPFSSDPSPEPN